MNCLYVFLLHKFHVIMLIKIHSIPLYTFFNFISAGKYTERSNPKLVLKLAADNKSKVIEEAQVILFK